MDAATPHGWCLKNREWICRHGVPGSGGCHIYGAPQQWSVQGPIVQIASGCWQLLSPRLWQGYQAKWDTNNRPTAEPKVNLSPKLATVTTTMLMVHHPTIFAVRSYWLGHVKGKAMLLWVPQLQLWTMKISRLYCAVHPIWWCALTTRHRHGNQNDLENKMNIKTHIPITVLNSVLFMPLFPAVNIALSFAASSNKQLGAKSPGGLNRAL